MASDSLGPMIDTPEVYQPPSIAIQIRKYLEAKNGDGIGVKYISNELGHVYSTVNTSLHRLKDKGLVRNKDGLWYATKKQIPADATDLSDIDTEEGCSHSQVYQVDPTSSEATALARQLWRHKHFHGLSAHIPSVSVDTVWSKTINERHYHLKEKKFWIKSTNKPIPVEDIPKVMGIIDVMLSDIDYDGGPIWLNRIETNTDLPGFTLDGAQRIEVRSLFGTLYRLYNKQIKDKGLLRAETVNEFESGVLTLEGGLYTLDLVVNSDNIHTVNQSLMKKSRHIYNEMAKSRQSFNSVNDKLHQLVESVQGGQIDLDIAVTELKQLGSDNQYLIQTLKNEVGQKQDLTRDILHAIVQGNDMAARQRTETNQRLGTQINQNELIIDRLDEIEELTREVKEQNVNWKKLTNSMKYDVFRELRKQRYTLNEIADFIGYSSRSGAYNWAKRNYPDLLEIDESDTVVNKDVNVNNDNGNSSKIDLGNVVTSVDTPVYNPILLNEMLETEYGLTIESSVPQSVRNVLKVMEKATAAEVIEKLPHKKESQIRSRLSELVHKHEEATKEGDYYIWEGSFKVNKGGPSK